MTHLPDFGSQRRNKRLGHYENSDGTAVVFLLSFRRKCRLRLATHLRSPQTALPFAPSNWCAGIVKPNSAASLGVTSSSGTVPPKRKGGLVEMYQ